MILGKLAWRNIWRNKRRSIIILSSIAVGIVATVITDALSRGMVFQMLDNQVGSHVSHIQIHREGFRDNPVIQSTVPHPAQVEELVTRSNGVKSWSKRIITFGLISSATSSSGVSIVGVDPTREQTVTKIRQSIIEGSYLSDGERDIIIGEKLAEKLGVGPGDKVVAMASALDGHIGSDVFRIVGLYETFSSEFDKAFIYIPLQSAQRMLSMEENVSEFALVVDDLTHLNQVQDLLKDELTNGFEILTYPEVLPFLIMQIDLYAQSMFVFYAIIGFAVIFGIINTMLMSVFERIREFGVLKAIGMKNGRLFVMVILEAFYLGVLGSAIGMIIGYVVYLPLSNTGLDLSAFSDSLRSFGTGTIIYPVMTWDIIVNALIIIPVIAVLGSVYPAVKAMRLQPISAIRHV